MVTWNIGLQEPFGEGKLQEPPCSPGIPGEFPGNMQPSLYRCVQNIIVLWLGVQKITVTTSSSRNRPKNACSIMHSFTLRSKWKNLMRVLHTNCFDR